MHWPACRASCWIAARSPCRCRPPLAVAVGGTMTTADRSRRRLFCRPGAAAASAFRPFHRFRRPVLPDRRRAAGRAPLARSLSPSRPRLASFRRSSPHGRAAARRATAGGRRRTGGSRRHGDPLAALFAAAVLNSVALYLIPTSCRSTSSARRRAEPDGPCDRPSPLASASMALAYGRIRKRVASPPCSRIGFGLDGGRPRSRSGRPES